MYLKQEILPTFNKWIKSLTSPITLEESKKYARYFIINHIDPIKIKSRGEVYDLFESVYKYADMKKLMYQGQMDAQTMLCADNMHNIAYGIVWAMEHDAFDRVKYDPITEWGMDIRMGMEHMG